MDNCECGGKFFLPGKNGDMTVSGCSNCGRPYRSQPSPIVDEMRATQDQMIDAAADGGYNQDMSGNPLKEGILEDNGWQNRNKRDEFVGSTLNQDPYLPWWHVSSEEHQINGDAEIESVMPPTTSDSPTIEARLVDGIPGWHMATNGIARIGDSLGEPLLIDGKPFSPELARELSSQYGGRDHPQKTFMISHPDEDFLNAVKEVIETGRPGKNCQHFSRQMAQKAMEDHKEKHDIYDSSITLNSEGDRGHFHNDNEALSRALYGTQAYVNGIPYVSSDQSKQHGLNEAHKLYESGENQIPISTSHPELGEVLQRVSDMRSMSPLTDWLMNSPSISKDQEKSFDWLLKNRKMGNKTALVGTNPLMPDLTGPDATYPSGHPSAPADPMPPIPETATAAEKEIVEQAAKKGLLKKFVPGLTWPSLVDTAAEALGAPDYKDKPLPPTSDLNKTGLPDYGQAAQDLKWLWDNTADRGLDAVADGIASLPNQIEGEWNDLKGVGSDIGDAAKGVGNAIGDAATGVGNAIGDLFGGGEDPKPESLVQTPPAPTKPTLPKQAPKEPDFSPLETPKLPVKTPKPAEPAKQPDIAPEPKPKVNPSVAPKVTPSEKSTPSGSGIPVPIMPPMLPGRGRVPTPTFDTDTKPERDPERPPRKTEQDTQQKRERQRKRPHPDLSDVNFDWDDVQPWTLVTKKRKI